MRAGTILVLFALAASLAASGGVAENRPMDQMHGGCGNYAVDLKAEMRLMAGPALAVTAGPAAEDAPRVETGRALEVTLLPQAEVRFAAPPVRNSAGDDRRGGLLRLGVLHAGDWRVSADRYVWIDLAGAGRLLASPGFEMQTGCATIFKTIVFRVPEATAVDVQLSGASSATVRLLVTPLAAQ